MAKCGACGKFLSSSSAATCSLCPCMFHKGCVAIPDANVVPKDWVCPECKKKQRKGDNSCTPVKGICGTLNLIPEVPTTLVPSPVSSASVVDSESREMRLELASCISEMREMRSDIGEIRDIRNELSGIRKILDTNLTLIMDRMDNFEQRLQILESKTDGSNVDVGKISNLEEVVAQLKSELNDRDQDALLADLEIGHLPEEKGENIHHTVTVFAAKLGISLEERDVVFAERVGPPPAAAGDSGAAQGARARRVVVRLARRHTRDEFLRAARVRRNVTSVDLGHSGPPARVYVNERLTRVNRQLFQRVREECRKQHWRYSWTRRGRIYARKGDGKEAFQIRSVLDLTRVFGSPGVCPT